MEFWKYIILCLLASFRSVIASRRIHHRNYKPERFINSNTICGNTAGLNDHQTYLCSNQPHSVASAIQGMQVAVHECKMQFKNHRWNCSALETRNKIPQTSSFLRNENTYGSREAAFAFAIASAGVVHQVAHACSLGKIKECECQQTQTNVPHLTASERKKFHKQLKLNIPEMKRNSHSFERAGCSHNVNFGLDFATEFLDSGEERDFVSRIRSHNNRVGRLVVANNMKENCRCHGQSGSCSMQTCWKETPNFKAVGDKIKQKYEEAVRVSHDDFGNNVRRSNSAGSDFGWSSNLNVEKLYYFKRSSRYCNPNPSANVAGTTGRICNHTAAADEPNSCEELCCHRGYQTHKVKRVEPCRCRFHWCCYVNCEQCEWEETVSVCN